MIAIVNVWRCPHYSINPRPKVSNIPGHKNKAIPQYSMQAVLGLYFVCIKHPFFQRCFPPDFVTLTSKIWLFDMMSTFAGSFWLFQPPILMSYVDFIFICFRSPISWSFGACLWCRKTQIQLRQLASSNMRLWPPRPF